MTWTAVLLASLIGSLHCAAMCGGFATLAVGGARGPIRGAVAYALGRLIAYQLLGGLAGTFGAALEQTGALVGIRGVAGFVTAATLASIGVRMLVDPSSSRKPITITRKPGLRARLRAWISPIYRQKGSSGALLIGLGSALLPCGWLWGFVAAAAATGDPVGGVAVMTAFWLGTVPMLAGVGLLARSLVRRLGPSHRRLVGVAMLVLALLAAYGKFSLGSDEDPHACCRGGRG